VFGSPSKGGMPPEAAAPITYAEAAPALLGQLTEAARAGIVREDWSAVALPQRLCGALRPVLKTAPLKQQRDDLLALARTPMDTSALHQRVLMGVHRAVTGEAAAPARFGPHWERIGFQGDDPATDLRGSGMLSLVQVLHMSSRRPQLLKGLFTASQDGTAFPLMTTSINMTQLAMMALRAGGCTREANACGEVAEALHAMHAACSCYFLRMWTQRQLTIADFGFLKKEIEALALRKPAALFKQLRQWERSAAATGGAGGGAAAARPIAKGAPVTNFSSLG